VKQIVSFLSVLLLLSSTGIGHADRAVYTLGSGDKIRIIVFDEEDLSGEFEVSGEGALSLPLIGTIPVKAKTLREIEIAIQEKLLDGFLKNPRVNIEVLNYRPFYILGEVFKPGSYPYVIGMTVLNAVALGGGFSARAKKDNITIIRATDPRQLPQTVSTETIVLPGDVVRVEERFF
jgi:protein involved in polysaccharide export with SLBB domain